MNARPPMGAAATARPLTKYNAGQYQPTSQPYRPATQAYVMAKPKLDFASLIPPAGQTTELRISGEITRKADGGYKANIRAQVIRSSF